MVADALRGYLQLASGLTEVTRARAREAARSLVEHAESLTGRQGDPAAQVKSLADDLATAARSNRDLLVSMIRAEVERAVASLGVATREDLTELRRRLTVVERAGAMTPAKTAPSPAKKSSSAKTAATKTAATKTAATKTAATETAPRKTAASKTAAAKKATPTKKSPSARRSGTSTAGSA